ncbi:unnamed protein product [Cylicostephanus goldi]|uniref:Uncharacterized protein n=1 Tax=Cylicostephanus goldi TaxID=71465 RepID=A0A3P7Q604_CYLGO|nr:unnamed protein product [Cylicostephanus goldi]
MLKWRLLLGVTNVGTYGIVAHVELALVRTNMDYGGYFTQQAASGIDGSVPNPFQLNANFNLNNSAGYTNGAQTQIYGQYTNPYLTGNR